MKATRFPLLFINQLIFLMISSCSDDSKIDDNTTTDITDMDGNVYHSVVIGNQEWMVENLKTTKYRNGDPIPIISDTTQWTNLTTGAYCNYNNDTSNVPTYGRLYNWYAVNDSRNIAPIGWHVTSDSDWTTLITFLGDSAVAGGKLKEADTTHWRSPNVGATNDSGFTALPGGYRAAPTGRFHHIRNLGFWWSTTESNLTDAWDIWLYYNQGDVFRNYNTKTYGFSVRCVKD